MTAPKMNRDAYRDAMGYLYCKVRGDQDGMRTIAQGIEDPAAAFDALADMSLGIAAIATNGEPTLWLDKLREDLDALLDAYDARQEDGGPDA